MIENPDTAETPDQPVQPAQPTPVTPPSEEAVRRRRLSVNLGDNRALFQIGLASLVATVIYFVNTAKVEDIFHLYLGETIIILAALPALG